VYIGPLNMSNPINFFLIKQLINQKLLSGSLTHQICFKNAVYEVNDKSLLGLLCFN
jgi:hypothetical protein